MQSKSDTAERKRPPVDEITPEHAAHTVRQTDPPETIQGAKALAKEFYARFSRDEISTRAAALAFFGILSLVPLLLIALAALGYVIHNPNQAQQYVEQFVARLLPGKQMTKDASTLLSQAHIVESAQGLIHARMEAAIFGLLSLTWTALTLFVTATAPMNAAWEVKEDRNWLALRLRCLAVFAGASLLFVLSLIPTQGPGALRNLHIPWLSLPQHIPWIVGCLFLLLSLALDIGMFALIYRYLPNAPVTWREALFGGVIAGLLWEAFKLGFALYLAHFGAYNKLYGALGGLVGLVTWSYYSCIVLLCGAILCKMWHEHEEGGVKCRAT